MAFETKKLAKPEPSSDVRVYCSLPEIVYWVNDDWKSVRMTVILDEAVAQGDLKYIKWVRCKTNHMCQFDNSTILASIEARHLDIVQYVLVLQPKVNFCELYQNAAEADHLHIVQRLLSEEDDLEDYADFHCELIAASSIVTNWLLKDCSWKDQSNKQM